MLTFGAVIFRTLPFEPLATGGELGFLFAIVGVVGLWVGRVNAVGRWMVGRVRAVGRSVNAVGRCIVGREKAVG